MSSQIVTANRLADGAVVYLTGEGRWTETLACARVADGKEEAAALLALAERSVTDRLVVAPYAFPVAIEAGVLRPIQMREIIRAAGPTVHPQFGRAAGTRCAAE